MKIATIETKRLYLRSFYIIGQKSYKKRGTDLTFEDYLYELTI